MLSSSSCDPEINLTTNTKKKRRPAGTPDPDAEVISLSPRTLMESDRYVCDICKQGFQREQNLQMHRRRHKVPWRLLKRDTSDGSAAGGVRKRVFVCPEPSCLHHDPRHALGDLVGIKKHFRRKHGGRRQWSCVRCGKGYAVHSDYKAHLKTCGTRGHSCDCGRVFSRVESFIEHQDACLSRPTTSPSPSSDANLDAPPMWNAACNLELQLLPPSTPHPTNITSPSRLQLSVGSTELEEATALAEKATADEARERAKKQVELAEQELANATRIRQQAQIELKNACAVRDRAAKQVEAMLLQITCHACRQNLRPSCVASDDDNSAPALTTCRYLSSS
ncbi:protein indeterminate-domain 14 [Typha latifolia]|uniref:protein indeterminate-domain 14 n=1 Tax=Typha latifolia TaxID=4733 RepID=UPI003C2FD097